MSSKKILKLDFTALTHIFVLSVERSLSTLEYVQRISVPIRYLMYL